MGANCILAVKTVVEGRKWIEDTANEEHCLNPDGDACILNTKTGTAYVYRLWFDRDRHGHDPNVGKWRTQKVKIDRAQVKAILPTVAGIYGPKPSRDKPFIAMIRLD